MRNKKNFFKEIFLLLLLFHLCFNDCIINSFPELNYPKARTLENGYHLMITTKGIFSLYPGLSGISYSYNFTNEQILSSEIESMNNTINQVEISQFTEENGGKKYIVALAKNFIYFMNEKGRILFLANLQNMINAEYSISLIAYKYLEQKYYFVIAYNYFDSDESQNYLLLGYYFIEKKSNTYHLQQKSVKKFNKDLNENRYIIHLSGLSCQIMISSTYGKVLTCFESVQENNRILAFFFNPDNNFELLMVSNGALQNEDNKNAAYIKTCINDEKTRALICYSIVETMKLKCISYEINSNTFYNVELLATFCSTKFYGYDIYFFNNTKEYVLTCDNIYQNSQFHFIRLNEQYGIINDDKTNTELSSNCNYYDFSSIIYISKYNHYSALINANCDSETSVKLFMLSKNECKKVDDREQETDSLDTEELESKITIPDIITTIPIIETTVITTFPIIESTIVSTVPNTETTIITTIPIIKTTIPKIETTIPIFNIITTFLETEKSITTSTFTDETTNIEINNNFPDIESTYFEDSNLNNQKTEYLNFETEKLCNDNNKIYHNGECVCDNQRGFYSIKTNPPDDKCYKIGELPNNFYFNNKTKTYELCYESCQTCNKSGNFTENNCLICAEGFTKEPKNPLNCVEKCKYLYYYNSLEQYTCTEDEQCPDDASLIIRKKNKCINKCLNDEENIYQYNGECISNCPNQTTPNEYFLCQINNISICSSSDYKLTLDNTISEDNVKLTVKNYATEFSYTDNHISKFISSNFTMVLYKNNFCIDELKLNITKIEYDSCINKLKKENNIDENKKLIYAVIDIINGDNQITSFGFFNPDTGEKLNASKSCSDQNVIMYENLLSVLNNPTALELLQEQKINIFDLNSEFYNDICFHFKSPNGKDATLQDRIKTFYPDITLCDPGCRNKGINMTSLKAECECKFHDLLSKSILDNDLLGNNVLIKESLQEIADMINNLNIEVLMCYKDIFDIKYFKKNISGFIIITLFFFYSLCIMYYFLISKNKLIRSIYSLTQKFILYLYKRNGNNIISELKVINHNNHKDTHSPNKKKEKLLKKSDNKKSNNKIIRKSMKNITGKISRKSVNIVKSKFDRKNKFKGRKSEKSYSQRKYNLNQFNILNFNFKNIKIDKNQKEKYSSNRSTSKLLIDNLEINKLGNEYKTINMDMIADYSLINNNIDLKNFLDSSSEKMDYDDTIELDKRTFCQYLGEKIAYNQIILNILFISEPIKPKSIKIAFLITTFDIYFLTNGLFYSDSYISERFNSKEKEKTFDFISRSTDRFIYSIIIGNIIAYIITLFFVEENKIKKMLLKFEVDSLTLRYEITRILKSIIKNINVLITINYIIIIFSWYYLSCFYNAYPNINKEWIFSSLFIIVVMQIIPIIIAFIETCIRFLSIKCESEKLFKLSLLLS